MTVKHHVQMMTRYMEWADSVMIGNASRLSEEELVRERDALFGSISGTFDHILLVGEVFKAHLEGVAHPHASRHRQQTRAFSVVAEELRQMNRYYVEMADSFDVAALDEVIKFEFVGGGPGAMSRAEILLHLANHSTYHRGFISTMLYSSRIEGKANDLSVFLRDAWPELLARLPSENFNG
tara:strand:- start:43503 stop:44045 length:543 start_codon:yes stop_codon:yes gene_type:complete